MADVIAIGLGLFAALMMGMSVGEMRDRNEAGQVQLSLIGAIIALGFLGLLVK